MSGLTVRTHARLEDVPAASWRALTARSPASVTGSRAWLEAALATVDRDAEPHLLTVWRGDRPIGLLALVRERAQTPKLRFAAAPFNDLTDLLARRGDEAGDPQRRLLRWEPSCSAPILRLGGRSCWS